MNLDLHSKIKNDKNLSSYLRQNSGWYKYLNRNPGYIKDLNEQMKKAYKLTPKDKLEKVNNNMQLISEMLKILK